MDEKTISHLLAFTGNQPIRVRRDRCECIDRAPKYSQGSRDRISHSKLPEDYPEYVSFRIKGYLPESCLAVDRIDINQNENTFEITVVVGMQNNVDCIQEAQYFDKEYLLSTEGMPSDTYAVTAGEHTIHFLVEDEEGLSGG